MRYLICLVSLVVLLSTNAFAARDGEIPGAKQEKPVALTNATVFVGNGTRVTNATVLFDGGTIVAIGTNVSIPAGAEVVDCSGKFVYPGFITPLSTIGLVEIDAVRSSRDNNEVGALNPNVRAETAYNPDSEIIPTIRSNGILLANVSPEGGIISGQSSLMRLDGWTREDIAVLPRSGMLLNWPYMGVINAWWMKKSAAEQIKEAEERVQKIHDYFQSAYAYARGAEVGLDPNTKDIRFEAMRRVFDGSVPLIVEASTQVQIESALDLADKYSLKIIISGGRDAMSVVERLKKTQTPIIVQQVHSLPGRSEDPYDQSFVLPAQLKKAGIPFCLSAGGSWRQRDLPFQAGTAVAFGLDEDAAVEAITLSPARIFGVESEYGSIEAKKSATLFVSSGNALDSRSNVVERAWIDGREVDLDNRHKRLSRKYRTRATRK